MPVGVLVEDGPPSLEVYDAVNAKLGGDVEGLLLRTAGQAKGGGIRVYTVWESQEAFERFREERLLPTMREVAGEDAPSEPPQAEVYELHDLFVKP